MTDRYDYIIVGSGIAGLYTALLAREQGSVLLVTKGSLDECNTKYAQGGIAAAIGRGDSADLHFKDTIVTGTGLSDPVVVRMLVDEAADRIADLVNLGVPFDTADGEIALTLEAAHSLPRILHAGGDTTGAHIEDTLGNWLHSAGVKLLEDCLATEILVTNGTVCGLKALDCHSGRIKDYECRFLILATGGAGQLFKYTTNSSVSTGDGIALACSAGAAITDMEFFQFHPTALRLPGVTRFLISEAVRGEGGRLVTAGGSRFMDKYSPQGDLAPRDIVSRSILAEMVATGRDNVFLDITHMKASYITSRFPQIYRVCKEHGLDITRELIPVAPAAHYMIGGVRVNSWGETSIAGLFAAGETAGTGVHGANRLASNSLLEVIVFGKRIIERSASLEKPRAAEEGRPEDRISLSRRQPAAAGKPGLAALKRLLWHKAGIIRDGEGLTEAADTLFAWQQKLPPATDRPSYELANLVLTGRLLVEAALYREESRGVHFRSDFPASRPYWQRHIVFT
ncbi:MAG: L-aspartate oxidase [Dehalococcoidales bacterium]